MVNVILSVLAEYVIFAYYLNSAESLKMSRCGINALTAFVYAVYAAVCVFSNLPMLNVVAFFAMNMLLLSLGWKKTILFNSLSAVMLTAFMMFSELLVGIVFNIGVGNTYTLFTMAETFILFAFSKVIYFLCVAILRRYTINRTEKAFIKEEMMFLLLPAATCVFFNAFAKIRLQVDPKGHTALVIVSVLLIGANVFVYLVYNMITDKNMKIRSLVDEEHKREIEYKSYELIKERYEDLRMLVHDFEKYCNNIDALIQSDTEKAKEEIHCLRERNRALLLVERTNNKALNVILDQKMRECSEKGIDFQINIQNVDLSYINELDTVTVFSNLLDNATEGCAEATEKAIELEIFVINDSYTAIRIENSCHRAPECRNGWFVTTKENKVSHGLGLKSVERALNNYGAKMKCAYETETNTFTVTILINNKAK
ncbi:MAG: GHKL domain-containing protein [Clostridia bacterium]|nr:GHKL domain-containing protein [Clostridia bacterium]